MRSISLMSRARGRPSNRAMRRCRVSPVIAGPVSSSILANCSCDGIKPDGYRLMAPSTKFAAAPSICAGSGRCSDLVGAGKRRRRSPMPLKMAAGLKPRHAKTPGP